MNDDSLNVPWWVLAGGFTVVAVMVILWVLGLVKLVWWLLD